MKELTEYFRLKGCSILSRWTIFKEEKKISLLATQNRSTLTNRIFKRIVAQPNPPQIPLDILKLYNNSRVIDTFRSLSTKFYPSYVPHYLSP